MRLNAEIGAGELDVAITHLLAFCGRTGTAIPRDLAAPLNAWIFGDMGTPAEACSSRPASASRSRLCAMAIHDLGHEAISFTGSQAGIVTDATHTKAKINEIRAQRIHKALDEARSFSSPASRASRRRRTT